VNFKLLPILVVVLVHIEFFLIYYFALVGNVLVRVVTGCTFFRLIAGIQVSLSLWRDIGGGQTSIEVQDCQEVSQCRLGSKWDFMYL